MSGARSAALGAAAAAAVLALLAPLVPGLPPIELLGGDGLHYARMAEAPLDPVAPPPYAERIAVPLLAAALPLGTKTAFFLLALVSTVAAGALVALFAREVGVGPLGQAGAAALATGSYAGVHALYNPYYVDPTTLAVVAGALVLAVRRRWAAFALVASVGVLVKEPVATLVVVPYLVERAPGRLLDGRAARIAAAAAVPVLAAFALVQALAPAAPSPGEDMRTAFLEVDVFQRGVLTSAVGPVIALFGLALLLWPPGVARGPAVLARLHVWAGLSAPILVLGYWERTLAVWLPLALAAALLALAGVRPGVLAAVAAGSLWISGVVTALTIGEGETAAATKLALLLPGAALGLAALAWHLRAGSARPAAAPR